MGRGVPLPSRLEGLGERRKLPQQGAENEFLTYLELEKTHLIATKSAIFDIFHFCSKYFATFAFTINKHQTFTYYICPVAQLERLCKFFHILWGGLGPHSGYAYAS